MSQGPPNDVRILVGHTLKPRVELLELTGNPAGVGAFFLLRVGPVRREHWIKGERHKQGDKDRTGNCERERFEPLASHAIHEGDRHEHRDDRKCRCRHREPDFVRAFVRCPEMVFPHLDMAHDVLAHHNRIVDQYPDRQ